MIEQIKALLKEIQILALQLIQQMSSKVKKQQLVFLLLKDMKKIKTNP